jgi:hypothetical protein
MGNIGTDFIERTKNMGKQKVIMQEKDKSEQSMILAYRISEQVIPIIKRFFPRDMEDVKHDFFMHIMNNDKIEDSKYSLGYWKKTARNFCIDKIRLVKRKHGYINNDVMVNDLELTTSDVNYDMEINKIINGIPNEKYREIIGYLINERIESPNGTKILEKDIEEHIRLKYFPNISPITLHSNISNARKYLYRINKR